jgi:hypothetical protein
VEVEVVVLCWVGNLWNCWGYVICGAGGGGGCRLWCSGMVRYLGVFVVERMKDRMVSIAGG